MHEPRQYDPAALDDVERLIHAGGRRAIPDVDRRERARNEVRRAWSDAVRARMRRRWTLAGASVLAAAATIAFAVALRRPPAPPPTAPLIVARVAAATGALHLIDHSGVRTITAGDAVPAGATVETPVGVVAMFAIEGGGELRQNDASSVRWTTVRHVALDRGQIYIDTGAAHVPLSVDTVAGRVRDIGTRFAVLVRDGALHVRVREGAVRLESSSGHRDASAGRELVAVEGRAVVNRQVDTYGAEWDWLLRATPFRLEGATVARFLDWVETDGGRRIEFGSPRLREDAAAAVLHGSIDGLSIDQALETVLPAAGLSARRDGDRLIVTRGRQ
jgi:ferric-dicitrate binding protein FerR (iron transport regulator)